MTNYHKLSDKELYALCKKYGLQARLARRQFAGLLPEVLRRRLYKKKGYTGIHEFAAKLAGMSKEAVDKVLRLATKLEDKPALKEQLISGEQGWSKIEKVAYIATPETDQYWAERVEAMPKVALEAFIHEVRKGENLSENFRLELTPGSKVQPAKSSTIVFHMKPDLERKFRMYKHELEQVLKMPLTCEDTLEALLEGKSFASARTTIQICPNCIERMGLPESLLRG